MTKPDLSHGPHAAVYPWEHWFATRKEVKLEHGKDFDCTLGGMTINIRQAAKRYGIRVRISQSWSPEGRGLITFQRTE